MKLTDFDYHLPKELIAQTPIYPRDESRLLIFDRGWEEIQDKIFKDICDYLWESDVLVVNKTRVINARLKWQIKTSLSTLGRGARGEGSEGVNNEVEIFLHKQISDNSWDCLVYPWKKLKPWTKIHFKNSPLPMGEGLGVRADLGEEDWAGVIKKNKLTATIKSISEKWRIVEFNIWRLEFLKIVEEVWDTPLPPYIKESLDDKERYQTVYNEVEWSSAAPTAWLHFTDELLERLESAWVKIEKVLLHVWLGTFWSVDAEDIEDHKMHSEYIDIEEETAKRLNQYKKDGKNIIAVWTTSVRTLESFSDENWVLRSWSKETDIFIYPWYKWKFVDSLITNFHLPKSTLLMLVSSLAGKENIDKVYTHAIKEKYRFFSFWDAMRIK